VRLELPQPGLGPDGIAATVLYVDRFGNVQLNLRREHLDRMRIEPGTRLELDVAGRRLDAVAARTFADAPPGAAILYEDSYRNVAIGISQGNAADAFGARAGHHVLIRLGRQ
jgi:S-adenosyl-L-methionine hydrolase (adenosine-forming)